MDATRVGTSTMPMAASTPADAGARNSLIAGFRGPGGALDARGLAEFIDSRVGPHDWRGAATMRDAIGAELTPVERGVLARQLDVVRTENGRLTPADTAASDTHVAKRTEEVEAFMEKHAPCPVAEVEVGLGFVIGRNVEIGHAKTSVEADAGSFRVRLAAQDIFADSGRTNVRVTQGVKAEHVMGIGDAAINVDASVGREQVIVGEDDQTGPLRDRSFEAKNDEFVGIAAGGAFIGLANVRLGFEPRNADGTCY